jgi:hypothetical protein
MHGQGCMVLECREEGSVGEGELEDVSRDGAVLSSQ